jgi:DNA-binding MarR family transcriptional regulator
VPSAHRAPGSRDDTPDSGSKSARPWPVLGPKEKDLYARVGFVLRRAQQLFAEFAAKDLAALKVTLPQAEALIAIASAPSPDQATVARFLGLDAATVTLVIDGLEGKKLAERRAHEDRRRRVPSLSPRGERALAKVLPPLKNAGDELLRPLTKTAADRLLRELTILGANPESNAPLWFGSASERIASSTPLNALLRSPGFLVRRALQVCNAMFHASTAEHGVTTQQYASLAVIAAFPDLDQAALSRVTWSGRSTAVPLLRALEARGYIKRVSAAGDARRRVFSLLPSGDALLRSMYPDIRKSEQKFLLVLAAPRGDALLQQLRSVVLAHDALHFPEEAL